MYRNLAITDLYIEVHPHPLNNPLYPPWQMFRTHYWLEPKYRLSSIYEKWNVHTIFILFIVVVVVVAFVRSIIHWISFRERDNETFYIQVSKVTNYHSVLSENLKKKTLFFFFIPHYAHPSSIYFFFGTKRKRGRRVEYNSRGCATSHAHAHILPLNKVE